MTDTGMPYVTAYGRINKTLEAIQRAQTPDRFTQDFLANRLQMKGGSARAIIPFLKKTNFLSSDGSPTELYKSFRNPERAGSAAAKALKAGFSVLYEIDERAHELSDDKLKGIVIQATGIDGGSSTLKSIIGSFKALRSFASFDSEEDLANQSSNEVVSSITAEQPSNPDATQAKSHSAAKLNLGYTINLNLPATSDVAVFDAIFTSLRQHILS
jgi:hypothetical protein